MTIDHRYETKSPARRAWYQTVLAISKCINGSSPKDANATVAVHPVVRHVLFTVGSAVLGLVAAPVIMGAIVGALGFGAPGVIAGRSLVL